MFGSLGVLETDGFKCQCHICGRWFKGLGSHAWRTHDITADDYRAQFELRYTQSLLAPKSSEILSASISKVMDLDRLALYRKHGNSTKGKKRRLQSKLSPEYKSAQAESARKMRIGYEAAKLAGTIPPVVTDQLRTPEARRKSAITRAEPARAEKRNARISESLKRWFAEHGPHVKPPITEETRKRMSDAARLRGIADETRAKIKASLKERYAGSTIEDRRNMFKGKKIR